MSTSATTPGITPGKRKENPDDRISESYIPLPIQNFLLQQTCFFIQPSQQTSARDGACLTFERVLVQNILHGMSPTFCEAIQSISRWQLIRVAFPHVMHCASVMLKDSIIDSIEDGPRKFESSETKLLYTLHWIILDAASECEDNDSSVNKSETDPSQYLHDITSIQLFVYLFAPLVADLRESDFQSLKLENGLRIWSAMKNFLQPDVPCFSAPVKPKRKYMKVQKRGEQPPVLHNTNTGQIYLGRGSSMEKLMPFASSGSKSHLSNSRNSYVDSETGTGREDVCLGAATSAFRPSGVSVPTVSSGFDQLTPQHNAPIARLSDICPLSTQSGETVSLEVYCERCNSIVANKHGEMFGCRCRNNGSKRDSWSFIDPRLRKLNVPVDLNYKQTLVENLANQTQPSPPNPDVLSATHFDLAVLRCLFCPKWDEDGVFWAIRYVHKRLLEIRTEESKNQDCERPRSHSLPLPNILSTDDWFTTGPGGESSSASADPSITSDKNFCNDSDLLATHPLKKPKRSDLNLKEKFGLISKLKRIESTDRDDEKLMDLRGKIRSRASPTSLGSDANVGKSNHMSLGETSKPSLFPGHSGSPHLQILAGEEDLESDDEVKRRISLQLDHTTTNQSSDYNPGGLSPKRRIRSHIRGGAGYRSNKHHKYSNLSNTGSRLMNYTGDTKPLIKVTEPPQLAGMGGVNQSHSLNLNGSSNLSNHKESTTSAANANLAASSDDGIDNDGAESNGNSVQDLSAGGPYFKDSTASRNANLLRQRENSVLSQKSGQSQQSVNLLPLHRCLTDSNISYKFTEQVDEVAGSVHYIQSNGHLNYAMILKAIFWVSKFKTTPRVCEYIMHILACLIDLNIFDKKSKSSSSKTSPTLNLNRKKSRKDLPDSKSQGKGRKASEKNVEECGKPPRHMKIGSISFSTPSSGLRNRNYSRHSLLAKYNPGGSSNDSAGNSLLSGATRARLMSSVGVPGIRDRRTSAYFGNTVFDTPDIDLEDEEDEEKDDPQKEKNSPPPPSEMGQLPGLPAGGLAHLQVAAAAASGAGASSGGGGVPNILPPMMLAKQKMKENMGRLKHFIAMDIVMRVIRALGCSHGHGVRSDASQDGVDLAAVRTQTHNCLLRLYHLQPSHFRKYLVHMAGEQALTDIVEMLHAFTGFCMDPAAHISPKLGVRPDCKASYRNSFGQSVSGEGTRGAEGIVINCMLNRFIQRLVENKKELNSQENMILYSDIRQLLVFLREVHGSTFRRTLLSSLLMAVKKPKRRFAPPGENDCAVNRESDGRPSFGASDSDENIDASGGSNASSRAQSISVTSSGEQNQRQSHKHVRTNPAHRTFVKKSPAHNFTLQGRFATRNLSNQQLIEEQNPTLSDTEVLLNREEEKFINDGSFLENVTPDLKQLKAPSPRSSYSEKEENENQTLLDKPKKKIYKKHSKGNTRVLLNKNEPLEEEACRSEGETVKDLSNSSPAFVSNKTKKKISYRPGQATLSFLSARRRIEETMKMRKPAQSKCEDAATLKKTPSESDLIVKKSPERRLVDVSAVKYGLLQFTFMLESCEPGSVAEPQLVAALLDLKAPVAARACILLECAHFVHRCNRGEWPGWMKFNPPGSYRHSNPYAMPHGGRNAHFAGGASTTRQSIHMQRMAGKMFHAWAEALGSQLEHFLRMEQAADRFGNIKEISDESRRRQLQFQDQEENFLDDSTVNDDGESCPYALKSVAIQLLLEITTYLRETHQHLPKASPKEHYGGGRDSIWEKQTAGQQQGNRRTSGAVTTMTSVHPSSPVFEESSPMSSLGDIPHHFELPNAPNARRISFAFLPEKEGEGSVHSGSQNSLEESGDNNEKKRTFGFNQSFKRFDLSRRSTGGKNFLRKRRGSGSFRKSGPLAQQGSFRQKWDSTVKRMGSMRRKVSTHSQLSGEKIDSDDGTLNTAGTAPTQGPGCSQANVTEVLSESETNEESSGTESVDNCSTYMPWIKVVTQFANRTNFVCEHQGYCHPNCYERQQRQCRRLLTAVRKIMTWEEGADDESQLDNMAGVSEGDLDASMQLLMNRAVSEADEKKISLFGKPRRKESAYPTAHSPHRRRESTPLIDKLRHDIPLLKPRTPGTAGTDDTGINLGLSLNSGGLERKTEAMSNKKKTPEYHTLKYLDTQAFNLTQNCFSVINKSALLLTEEHFADIMPVAWELLLESDQELTASAASVVLLSAIKIPELVQALLFKELQQEDVNQRMNAILRFRTLWSFRYQLWPRLEEGAQSQLKLPPPYIEFVLPSPTLGHPGGDVPDPPWNVRKAQSAEEMQLKQNEAAKTFVTASTTRRKQQQMMLEKAMATEEQRQKAARTDFHLKTCSFLDKASIEAAFTKEHKDEGVEEAPASAGPIQEEFNAAVRRLSVAPINRNLNQQTRNHSWRNGSISWFRANPSAASENPTHDEGASGAAAVSPVQPLQQAQCVFPSSIGAASVSIIHLLDDFDVNSDGISVGTVAEYSVWRCLVEDCALFLRYILERLTRVTKKDELIFVLRKLIQRMPELPTQAAHTLFNNLVGYIMFYVRTPTFSAPESIAGALSIIWMVVPYVQNIYFKDLKQILRKEQVDPTLLVTTNLPCAKQFNVFDDDVFVAQLVRLQDDNKDYRFSDILKEALESSNIPEEEHHAFFLCDDRSNIIRNSSHYVRDFYFFKRNHTPKLRLKKMDPVEGHRLLQKNAFNLKFLEIGKVMFTYSILQNTPSVQINNHVYFLHEELSKLPSFPRKALESEFTLYDGDLGRQLYGMDMLHKLTWCRTVHLLFGKMSPSFPWTSDIQLFLNVFNATLILHSDDTAMLRYVLSCYIQASQHFKMIFSVNGYMMTMPTILRVYNLHQHNEAICRAIEFTCKQFYILHRTPFILQTFGCIANHIDLEADNNHNTRSSTSSFYKITPRSLYQILQAISGEVPDKLNILGLLPSNKPLKALDFCYEEEDNRWSILESVNLCVTVIAYAPESFRAKQMMIVLRAILPFLFADFTSICKEEQGGGSDTKKTEIQAIQQLSVAIKQLISTTDWMIRLADRNLFARGIDLDKTSFKPSSNHAATNTSIFIDDRDESPYRRAEEGRNRKSTTNTNIGGQANNKEAAGVSSDDQSLQKSIIEPRESILEVACVFLTACHKRLTELGEKQRAAELLDNKSHMRLSDLAQSIIKQISIDNTLLRSKALLRYFSEIPPIVDWGHESVRSSKALESLIYRLSRTFSKIFKDAVSRRHLDWECATTLVNAVYATVKKNKNIAQLKDVKSLLEYLKKLILMDPSTAMMNDSLSSVQFSGRHEPISPTHLGSSGTIPPKFSAAVIKFLALMLHSLGDLGDSENSYKLKEACERSSDNSRSGIFDSGNESVTNYLANIIIPLLMRCGVGRKDAVPLSDENIYYAMQVLLTALSPYNNLSSTATNVGLMGRPLSGGGPGSNMCNVAGPSGGLLSMTEMPGGLTGLIGLISGGRKSHLTVSEGLRSGSVSHSEKSFKTGSDYVHRLAFHGLKLMMICYPRHILSRSRRICNVITDMGLKRIGGIHLWKFLDFLVTYRAPLFVTLLPFIKFKMSQIRCETQGEQAFQQILNQKMMGLHLPSPRNDAAYLRDLSADLRTIREELQGLPALTAFSLTLGASAAANLSPNPISSTLISPTSVSSHQTMPGGQNVQTGQHGYRMSVGGGVGGVLPSLTNSESVGSGVGSGGRGSTPGLASLRQVLAAGPPSSPTHDPPVEQVSATAFARSQITRNSGKRIAAKDGSRILNRFQLSRPDPILPVPSVDSLPSQTTADGADDRVDAEAANHRLQRNDAKSRKTYKLRRTRTATIRNKNSSAGTKKSREPTPGQIPVRDVAGGYITEDAGEATVPAGSATAATGLCYVVGGKSGFRGTIGASGQDMIEMGLTSTPNLAARIQENTPGTAILPSVSSDGESDSLSGAAADSQPRSLQSQLPGTGQRRYVQRSRSAEREDLLPQSVSSSGATVKGRLRAKQNASRVGRLLDSPILSGAESSEEALLAACGAALAESESSNTSASELSSLLRNSSYV